MSDAPQAQPAKTITRDRAARQAKRAKFERLHRDYLAARAACTDPDGPDGCRLPLRRMFGQNGKSSTASSPKTPRMVISSRTVSSLPSAPSRPISFDSG